MRPQQLQTNSVWTPITLPCGRTVRNRLAKVALYEHLAVFNGGPPNDYHFALYSEWGRHDWGMIFTGNVQVSSDHLTFGRDITVPDEITDEALAPYKQLAVLMQGSGVSAEQPSRALAIAQLSHTGRQSLNFLGGRGLQPPLGVSPVRVGADVASPGLFSEGLYRVLFSVPKEMSLDDIEHVISRFVHGARVAHLSGFDGVEIHAAHGYLLAQFISPKSNHRKDEFSLEHGDDLRVLRTVVSRIREAVPADFVLGIKLNVADYSGTQSLSDKETRVLSHIRAIAQWGGVDFIEMSGGDYESPGRQAFFSRMSQKCMEVLEEMPRTISSPPLPLVMLTGGLRTPALIDSALSNKHAQLVGIGRPAVVCPNLPTVLREMGDDSSKWPNTLFAPEPSLSRPKLFELPGFNRVWNSLPRISLIGAGVNVSWYEVSLRYLAEKVWDPKKTYPDYSVGAFGGLIYMWTFTVTKPATKSQRPESSALYLSLQSIFFLAVFSFAGSYLFGQR
ncbi:oxidoreductase [Coprinopsis marcescibilis]|uniref:Oxidoreductase n=1 Tax=Coprinopsis marcescibilis TaxID=230819 RepID=A0A5C3L352_COPMA|nr:oxidoreductase [Coprinopsis marcescibilis]